MPATVCLCRACSACQASACWLHTLPYVAYKGGGGVRGLAQIIPSCGQYRMTLVFFDLVGDGEIMAG